jgi:cyclopropane fatty-acyl-phospholipid synthase-like methyltransferase
MSTIDYYNNHANEYFNKTVNANMNDQYIFFLKYIKRNGKILDLGCGSGRDSLYFKNLGYEVTAIDGSYELCKLASKYTGLDVKCMDFSDISEEEYYDGIWACSSLVHVKKEELLNILNKVKIALKKDGYIYISLKIGTGEEVDSEGRYYSYLTKKEFTRLINQCNLFIKEYFESKSVVNKNEKRVWGNFILERKKDGTNI